MLLKHYTHYASKFGKLSSGHRTGKGQFSTQSHKKTMPRNGKITVHLHSFHMLARLYSKSFKLGFNSIWTENYQIYKLDLEKAEEPTRIKLPTSSRYRKGKKVQKKIPTSASLIMLKPLTVWITTTCGKFLKRWEYQTILPVSCETCMQVKKQQLELDMGQQTV